MDKKQTFAKKMLRFVEEKGFYVVVLLCVAALGLSGWYLTRSFNLGGGEDDPTLSAGGEVSVGGGMSEIPGGGEGSSSVSGEADIHQPAGPAPSGSVSPKPETTADPKTTPTPDTTEEPPTVTTRPEPELDPEDREEARENSAPAPLVYTWPVRGEVLRGHSGDTLVYDETMGDWRVHAGVDIAADPGTNVFAAADGTVTAVDQHDLMGTTVVIDHGQGMVSRYSNLQAVPTVGVGDKVYTGTVIGAVGRTAIAESKAAAHLHFVMTRNGEPVDPLEYLPGK